MYYKKLNNPDMWKKIKKLRALIKNAKKFKERRCWECGKELNVFDFLNDNLNFPAPYIFELWQNPLLEYHCCDCFKDLKGDELKAIDKILKTRHCEFCGKALDIYEFSRIHDSLKIKELKELWLDLDQRLFCNKICHRKFLIEKRRKKG